MVDRQSGTFASTDFATTRIEEGCETRRWKVSQRLWRGSMVRICVVCLEKRAAVCPKRDSWLPYVTMAYGRPLMSRDFA
jgi:hypothetical protein